jgi:hypothetical protein
VHRSSTRADLGRQPGVDEAFGEHLRDQRARHDHAFVDGERHALQPGLAGEVGGRAPRGDALADEGVERGDLGVGEYAIGRAVEVVQWQREPPQHEPGGLVERVGGAVPKRNARLVEAGAGPVQIVEQVHDAVATRRCSIVRR